VDATVASDLAASSHPPVCKQSIFYITWPIFSKGYIYVFPETYSGGGGGGGMAGVPESAAAVLPARGRLMQELSVFCAREPPLPETGSNDWALPHGRYLSDLYAILKAYMFSTEPPWTGTIPLRVMDLRNRLCAHWLINYGIMRERNLGGKHGWSHATCCWINLGMLTVLIEGLDDATIALTQDPRPACATDWQDIVQGELVVSEAPILQYTLMEVMDALTALTARWWYLVTPGENLGRYIQALEFRVSMLLSRTYDAGTLDISTYRQCLHSGENPTYGVNPTFVAHTCSVFYWLRYHLFLAPRPFPHLLDHPLLLDTEQIQGEVILKARLSGIAGTMAAERVKLGLRTILIGATALRPGEVEAYGRANHGQSASTLQVLENRRPEAQSMYYQDRFMKSTKIATMMDHKVLRDGRMEPSPWADISLLHVFHIYLQGVHQFPWFQRFVCFAKDFRANVGNLLVIQLPVIVQYLGGFDVVYFRDPVARRAKARYGTRSAAGALCLWMRFIRRFHQGIIDEFDFSVLIDDLLRQAPIVDVGPSPVALNCIEARPFDM
jgi:hypothetical protein